MVAFIGAQIAAVFGQQATTVLNALLDLSFTGRVLRAVHRARSRRTVETIRQRHAIRPRFVSLGENSASDFGR